MTSFDSVQAQTVDSALARVVGATDEHELEAAWVAGLRGRRDPADRDRILAAAGRRLHAFDEVVDDHLRHHWLDDVVHDLQGRNGEPLGEDLAVIMAAEIREAFARADDDLAALRKALAAGTDMHDFSAQSSLAATRLRDLGRMAERLRGTELMALVPDEDARLVRELADSSGFRGRLLAAVPESLRASRDDLLRWAAGAGADQELPRLLRRLIRETTQIHRIEFPSGTGIATPGWDGIVECAERNQFVPEGHSGWEVSVQQSGSDQKARDDYDKRVEEVATERRRDMHYVAVVCAPWTKARDFEQEKRSLGDFRSVRALNVNSLEDWLECAPSTSLWLRELMGEPVDGVSLLSAWWDKWLESTEPALNTGVVLAGREPLADTLRDRCQQPGGGIITIGGQVHRDEILAFVAAALVTPDNPDLSPVDALYVDDHGAAKRLLAADAIPISSPLTRALTVVVPSRDFAKHLPASSRHRMIVPIPGGSQPEIVLEAADSSVVAERLRAAGVGHYRADELGSLARMSLMALRRCLAINPDVYRPRWAAGRVEEALRRSLMLNSWDQSRDGDRQIVERFVGRLHEEVAETLNKLDSGDAPIVLTGEVRHVVSPMDTWTLLDHQLALGDLEAFSEVAHDVLTEPDPPYEMTGFGRMQARYDGLRAKYSSTIKRGVATTLALMGSRPPTLRGSITPASAAASGIVWRILRSANEDKSPRTWSAVVEVLPLLAEADPEAVLSNLRTCLTEHHAFADAMFADGDADEVGFPSPSPHLRVLDALEVLAWSSDHLMAAADVLARLAAIDPGGRWSNRPSESLASIMCAWSPNTSAAIEKRLTVVEMLRRQHEPVAWELMMSMLPGPGGIQAQERGPLYRGWKHGEPVVLHHDYVKTVESVSEMLLEDVGIDAGRWADLIRHVSGWPDAIRSELIGALGRVADTEPDEAFKCEVWPELHEMVTRHRRLSEANWTLPEAELALFDPLIKRLRPADPVTLYQELFSSGLMHVDDVSAADGLEAFRETLRPRQAEAVGAILSDGVIEAVLKFAEAVEQPRMVGLALASNDATLDIDMLELMHATTEVGTQVALGYFQHRFVEFGWAGMNRLIAENGLSPQVVADLHRAPPPLELPWTRVDAHGTEVASEYWARTTYYDIGIPNDSIELLQVLRRLRGAGRRDLVQLLLSVTADSHESDPAYAEEAAICLEQWIQEDSHQGLSDDGMVAWTLGRLIKVLGAHREHLGRSRVTRLEWQYYPILEHNPEFEARNLYREMARDPELFAWMVELAFKPSRMSTSSMREQTEASRRMAHNAFRVLRKWPSAHFVQASEEDSRIDAVQLGAWVDRARERLAEIDRAKIGDEMIGAALASSPADSDGEWPGLAVRQLIERLQSDSVDSGFYIAVRNQRGVTSRALTAGGAQERELARNYYTQRQRFGQWPRTAAIFAALAESYEREAEREDEEAEAHRRGLPR